jgi:hypothetical protein
MILNKNYKTLIKSLLVTEANHLPKTKQIKLKLIMFWMTRLIQVLTKLKLVKVIRVFLNLISILNLKLQGMKMLREMRMRSIM